MSQTPRAVVIALALWGCGAEPPPAFCALLALPAAPPRIEVTLHSMVVQVARDGTLRDDVGRQVTGFPTDEAGGVVGERGPIHVPMSVAGWPTTRVAVTAALPRQGNIGWFNGADPVSSSNLSMEFRVRDALGHVHPLHVFFTSTGPGTWEWHAGTDGAEIDSGIAGAWSWLAEGSLVFDADGVLVSTSQSNSGLRFEGAPVQQIAFEFAASELGGGTHLTDRFATINSLTSDDQPEGWLSSVALDRAGRLTTTYSNGRVLHPARLAFAAANGEGCGLVAPVTLDVSAGGEAEIAAVAQ